MRPHLVSYLALKKAWVQNRERERKESRSAKMFELAAIVGATLTNEVALNFKARSYEQVLLFTREFEHVCRIAPWSAKPRVPRSPTRQQVATSSPVVVKQRCDFHTRGVR